MKYSDFEHRATDLLSSESIPVDTNALVVTLGIGSPKRRGGGLWLATVVGVVILGMLIWLAIGHQSSSDSGTVAAASVVHYDADNTSTPVSITQGSSQAPEQPMAIADTRSSDLAPTVSTQPITPVLASQSVDRWTVAADERTAAEIMAVPLPSAAISTARQTTSIADKPVSTDLAMAPVADLTVISKATRSKEDLDIPALHTLAADMLDLGARPGLAPPTDKIKCPSFKIRGNRVFFSLIPEVGYMFAEQQLQDLSQETIASNMLRNDQEKALEGLQVALYGKVAHERSPLYLKAGLSYARISHRMPLTYEQVQLDTTQGVISLTTSPTGDTITAIIGDIITETVTRGNTTRHYYTYQLDLPIAVGYEQPLGSFVVGVEAGLNVNLRTAVSGQVLRTASEFGTALTTVDVNRRVGLGFFGGIQVGKRIEGIGDVYIAARARYIPDVSPEITLTDHKYMLYGLHAGYIMHF